jgi:hypothetical protein
MSLRARERAGRFPNDKSITAVVFGPGGTTLATEVFSVICRLRCVTISRGARRNSAVQWPSVLSHRAGSASER